MEDYEHKYNEALEKMSHFIKRYIGAGCMISPTGSAAKELRNIFPELKESEDERIKGAIIDHLKDNNLIEWADWLEKQGETFTKKDVDDAYLKGIADTKNEIEKQYEANYQIRRDIASFIFNYKGDIKDRAKWINYLGIKISFVEALKIKTNRMAINDTDEEIVEAVKDTSILDMIEPKFKIGDKVKNYYDRSLPQIVIKAIDNTRYYGDTANFDIAEQNQWGIVRSCDNCKCGYYLGKRSDCDSTFVSCYLHKDCGGDEPIIIDECDFIETAMNCQEFEENK